MEVLKKALVNRKKLANSENEKYQLGSSIESFISENLSRVNENIGFEAIKLRRTRAIHGWFTRDGVIHIKLDENGKVIKIFHKTNFSEHSLDYEEEGKGIFHDVCNRK